jgi:hypothetical protein
MQGKENKELNRAIVILIKLGFSKLSLSRIFNMDRRNLYRVWKRDKDKYNLIQPNATVEPKK